MNTVWGRALVATMVLGMGVSACAARTGVGTARSTAAKKLVAKDPFPTRAALEKITSTPPRPVPKRDVASAPQWTVDPKDDGKESVVEKHLGALTKGKSDDLVLSPDLRCAARELARFRAEHGASPDERVDRFIVGACGRSAQIDAFYTTASVPAKVKDEEILKAWRGKLAIPAEAKGKNAGAFMVRKGDKVTIAIALADPSPFSISTADEAGKVVVRGTAPPGSDRVVAMINRGSFGVERCEKDPSVALPEFALRCTMGDGDRWAWVQVMTHPEGHQLMHTLSLSIARRDDEPITLDKPSGLESLPADTSAAILEGVNRTRARASLAPLEPSVNQAAVNTRVAPHFFGAELAHETAVSDELALGLLAGWEVDGMIRNGTFFSGLISGTKDPASWLALALEMPMGRHSLLAPDARRIAIGAAALDGGPAVAAVVTTYAMFGDKVDHDGDRARVLARINEERTKRGLPPATSMGVLPDLVTIARLVCEGKREALDGLDSALHFASRRLQRSVKGWAGLSHDLDRIVIPNELLAPGPLQLSIEVTHFKPEGAAWGAYLVYVVTPADGDGHRGQVARADWATTM